MMVIVFMTEVFIEKIEDNRNADEKYKRELLALKKK